jgi:ribosomal protein S18 acetylase RimI-like enzyme
MEEYCLKPEEITMFDVYSIDRGYLKSLSSLYPLVDEFVRTHPDLTFRHDYRDAFARWISEMDGDNEVIFTAGNDGNSVGLIAGTILRNAPLLLPERYGYIPIIVTLSQYRRREVGKRLWQTLCQWFEEKGIHEVRLYTSPNNPPARCFWQDCSFSSLLEMRTLNL